MGFWILDRLVDVRSRNNVPWNPHDFFSMSISQLHMNKRCRETRCRKFMEKIMWIRCTFIHKFFTAFRLMKTKWILRGKSDVKNRRGRFYVDSEKIISNHVSLSKKIPQLYPTHKTLTHRI